jgi:23S rRNA (pseudouridine1915-N3)-methyltransferase
MRLHLICVGTRPPRWVEEGFEEYAKRMPRHLPLSLVEVRAEPRSGSTAVDSLRAREAERIRAALPPQARLVVLDERGRDLDTAGLSQRITAWQREGRDVALVVGGPDGLEPAIREAADETLRLSSLTLPHALVRVLLAEALYRAVSLASGHPYHRA